MLYVDSEDNVVVQRTLQLQVHAVVRQHVLAEMDYAKLSLDDLCINGDDSLNRSTVLCGC